MSDEREMVVREDVFAVVQRCVAESLLADVATVALGSRLVDDLGADSLDFVDIVFMLERELNIPVRETEFNFLTRLDFSSPEVMREGHLTPAVIDRLRPFLPAMRAVEDPTKVSPRALFSMITVEAICLVVQRRMHP